MAAVKGSSFMTINPRQAGALARRGAALQVERITKATAVRAAAIAPGSMKEKVRPIITGGSNPLGIVMVDHPAAHYVLFGTKGPYPIFPKKNKGKGEKGGVLRFTINGTVVYVRYVTKHPGIKANNVLMKAMMEVRGL